MLNFTDFKATRKRVSIKEGSETIQVDESYWSGDEEALHLYCDTLYIIEMKDGSHTTFIQHDGFEGDLETLEGKLYLEWYCSECGEGYTTVELTDLLSFWCEANGITPASADEIHHELISPAPEDRSMADNRKIAWIEWFSRTWEEVQAKEDTANSLDGMAG